MNNESYPGFFVNAAKRSLPVACFMLILFDNLNSRATERSPNIVLIVADDLGYGDVQCFGQDRCKIPTPHLDRLAQQGMRYTHAYATASVCVPSRMSIMTGRYAFRFNAPQKGGSWGFIGLQFQPGQETLATLLGQRGYRTGYVGKWHLGTLMSTFDNQIQEIGTVDYTKPLKIGPNHFGFDDSYILPGSLDMYPYAFVQNHKWVGDVSAVKGWSAFARMGPAAHEFEDTKVLETIAQQANQFIATNQSQPFFLYVALTAPHTPASPTADFRGKSDLGVYGDFVMNTDHTVGQILTALDQSGISQDTFVLFTSDHGPASYAGRQRRSRASQMKELEKLGHYAAGGLRGYKFSAYEGAFRVPLIARWPKKIPAGKTSTSIVGLVDLMATISEATDPSHKTPDNHRIGPDSLSFLTTADQKIAPPRRESILLQGTRGFAFRSDAWKLILCPGSGASGRWGNAPASDEAWRDAIMEYGAPLESSSDLEQPPFLQLYNLEIDPTESMDLARSHPDRVAELIAEMKQLINQGHSHGGSSPAMQARKVPIFRYVPKTLGLSPTRSH